MPDYFAMASEVTESGADIDPGSGGEMLLPDLTDSTGAVKHLVIGAGNKFIAPTVAGGKVFVGTTNTLAIFGLLH